MPLPITPSYEQRLHDLRMMAPNAAQLAEQIALAMRSEYLSQSAEVLALDLFTHLDSVGRQEAGCVTHLAVWLYRLAEVKALSHAQVTTFVAGAASLGGATGVVPLLAPILN